RLPLGAHGRASWPPPRILPRVHSLAAAVEAGSESLYGLEAEQF
ncbi:hypothetical protein ACV350_33520, partial [Pseudomonas aeruginosa]